MDNNLKLKIDFLENEKVLRLNELANIEVVENELNELNNQLNELNNKINEKAKELENKKNNKVKYENEIDMLDSIIKELSGESEVNPNPIDEEN